MVINPNTLALMTHEQVRALASHLSAARQREAIQRQASMAESHRRNHGDSIACYRRKCRCGTVFYAKKPTARYCSPGCQSRARCQRGAAWRRSTCFLCAHCGKRFKPARRDAKFHSPACRMKHHRQQQRESAASVT